MTDFVRALQAAAANPSGFNLNGGRERSRSDGWEAPMSLASRVELQAFPVEALPAWFGEFVTAVAEATQVPADLPGVLTRAALAAAAGGRVVVEPRPGWREPTNLFVASALGPGNRKSAVFQIVTRPLHVAERVQIAASHDLITAAEVERSVAEARAKDAARAAARATEDDDDNAGELLAQAKDAAAMAEAITVPTRPRLLVDDSTPEALTSILALQGGRAAVMSAEGGVFDVIAGRYSKGFPPLDVYLKGHAGDSLRVDRVGRAPEYIDAPALTLGLAIQPEVLRQIADRPGFRGRGLLARFLFSLPTSFVGSRAIGADAVPEHIQDRYDDDMQALVLSLAEWTDPAVLVFDADAQRLLLDFERELEPRLGPDGDLHHLADWGSKLAGAVVRIAGLLHLAARLRTGYREPISADTFTRARMIGEYFCRHALAVYEFMGADPILDAARVLLRWASTRDHFTKRDAHRALAAHFPKSGDLDEPLALLEDRGWIRRRPDPVIGATGGRRPSPICDVHPDTTNTTDRTHDDG